MVLIMAWFMATGAVSQDLEEQARIIGGKLMAPCCWAEPVSQHLSPVAEEMRGQIREMLAAGRSEQEILDFYVARYGERILASPPPHGFNLLAYILPPAFAAVGTLALVFILRRLRLRGNAAGPSPQKPVAGPNPYSERIEKELRDIDL
jgi:cytochrome c-type biogenesis protein CcmH